MIPIANYNISKCLILNLFVPLLYIKQIQKMNQQKTSRLITVFVAASYNILAVWICTGIIFALYLTLTGSSVKFLYKHTDKQKIKSLENNLTKLLNEEKGKQGSITA